MKKWPGDRKKFVDVISQVGLKGWMSSGCAGKTKGRLFLPTNTSFDGDGMQGKR